eukprot:COSAG02_NODE_5067_length_4676_cov_2.057243_1_plen_62_part_10
MVPLMPQVTPEKKEKKKPSGAEPTQTSLLAVPLSSTASPWPGRGREITPTGCHPVRVRVPEC